MNKLALNIIASTQLIILICLSIGMISSCTGLKHITTEDPLYTGSKVNIHGNTKISHELKDELKNVNRPKPNWRFLWMRPSIAIYNMMGNPKKEKSVGSWIKNKIGKPPVLSSEVSPENVSALMKNRFFNRGYFNARINYTTDSIYKKFTINYEVLHGQQYAIDSIYYSSDGTGLGNEIENTEATSILSKGNPYILDNFKKERERIENVVKDSGYYYFEKSFMIFRADTSLKKHAVKLQLIPKPQLPSLVYQKAYLNKIFIYDDFSSENYHPDTTEYAGLYYVSNRHVFRPDIITKYIHLYPGARYSRLMHFKTLKQLSSLGIYRFINAEFEEDSTPYVLNTHIYATPLKKSALTAEFNATIKTTNFVGPGVKISWRHRNVFGGAEELSFNILGSFEIQVGADSINTALEYGMEIGLNIPRPIIIKRFKKNALIPPMTRILSGVNFYNRVELYTMNSFFTVFGYSWKRSNKVSHNLNPVDITFSRLSNVTDAFREYLENNPTVRQSFEEQFIIGANYAFTYDNLHNPSKKGTMYFRGVVDVSGNIVNLLYKAFSGHTWSTDDPYTMFGVPFSQYFMFNPEFRYYLKTGRKSVLATRAIFGFGIPLGNSRVLPYIKQFFAGGTNSVRSFVARSIGPGSYLAPVENLGVDQTGDIRIEFNAEYRFNFTRRFLGAAFVDVGNVWLRNVDEERPGGDFQLDRFYKEFGIGTGFGFRFDLEVLILRLDMAWPLYVPYNEEGDRWVIGDFNLFSKDWRRQYLIWNFAIGYPF